MSRPAPTLNSSLLRSRLKLKNLQAESTFRKHHAHAVALLEVAGVRAATLREHATKLLAAGATAGSLLLTSPSDITRAALPPSSQTLFVSPTDLHTSLTEHLQSVLPSKVQPLTWQQEQEVSDILHDIFGLHATAELEGNRLNHSFGFIGAEQHLPRYPGDVAANHGEFVGAGITPGRGAWGYFARSRQELTPDLELTEKYYVAVQTLYLADWQARLPYYREWFKYRKVVVVNPENGKAVVAAIADSGPAYWTGKHFGGSPEVMAYLQRQDGRRRGPVILFFVDDPDGEVPLGPLEYNLEKGLPLT